MSGTRRARWGRVGTAAVALLTGLTLVAVPDAARAAPGADGTAPGADGTAPPAQGRRAAAEAAAVAAGQTPSVLAGPCDAGPALVDTWAELGSPYSFNEGVVSVSHRQWRIADVNFAYGWSDFAGTTMTMYRTDGARCGPETLFSHRGRYFTIVGSMKNTGHGIWVCMNWPGGGRCTAAKYE